MGILDSTTGQNTGDSTNVQNTTEDWVAEVVKEKGEQWSDPQALAKGYVHAQAEIERLKEFEAKASEQDYAKQLLDRLQAQAPATTPGTQGDPNQSSSAAEDTTLKPEDIESLISKTLSEREAAKAVEGNINKVEAYLMETYGNAADSKVQEAASRLGMTKESMREVAAKSPEAFKALLGTPEPKDTNTTQTSTVNTTEFQSKSTDRNAEYYSKLRRENKSLYMQPETQTQMMQDRVRLGDKW